MLVQNSFSPRILIGRGMRYRFQLGKNDGCGCCIPIGRGKFQRIQKICYWQQKRLKMLIDRQTTVILNRHDTLIIYLNSTKNNPLKTPVQISPNKFRKILINKSFK